jgi:ankyrin repeat protein
MGIHEDPRQGTLVGDRLVNYIKNNPNVLNEQDPVGGLTSLTAATVGGYAEEVEQLLKKGAEADALSRNGETPLLLAAWKTNNNRPRNIQLLLAKTPPG